MASRIFTAIATLILNLTMAAAMLLVLLIAMNGYGEGDATPGLVVYVVLSVGSAVLLAVAAALLVATLVNRGRRPVWVALLTTLGSCATGAGIMLIAAFLCIGIAEYVRTSR
jgi:hypothetical protein